MEASCLDGWILPHPKPGVVLGRQQLPSAQLALHSRWAAVEPRISSCLPALCPSLVGSKTLLGSSTGDGRALVPHRAVDAASVRGHSINLRSVAEANRCICFFALITIIKYLSIVLIRVFTVWLQ